MSSAAEDCTKTCVNSSLHGDSAPIRRQKGGVKPCRLVKNMVSQTDAPALSNQVHVKQHTNSGNLVNLLDAHSRSTSQAQPGSRLDELRHCNHFSPRRQKNKNTICHPPMMRVQPRWTSCAATSTNTPGASTPRSTEPRRRNACSSCCTVRRHLQGM